MFKDNVRSKNVQNLVSNALAKPKILNLSDLKSNPSAFFICYVFDQNFPQNVDKK